MIVVAVTVAISCMVFTSFVSLFLLLCFVFFCCSFLGWLHLINSIVLQLVTISLLPFCFSVRFLFVSLVGTLLLLLLLVLTLNNSQATWSWCDCCSHTLMFCPLQMNWVNNNRVLWRFRRCCCCCLYTCSHITRRRNYLQMSVDEVSILLLLLRLFDMNEHMQACRAVLYVYLYL